MARKTRKKVIPPARWPVWLALGIILLFGLYLRYYHVDYPVIGYHNWKETKYLTDARNFARYGFFKDGIFVPRHDFVTNMDYPLSGIHAETFPAVPIIVAVFFKIFGNQLWVARLIDIALSLTTVFFMYLFTRELFDREDLALLCALLTALNPMYVFFSHNTDIINAAILFMVASGYFYVLWLKQRKDMQLILATTFIGLAFATKQPHAILGIPMFLTFPFKDYLTDFRKNLRLTLMCAGIGLVMVGYIVYLGYLSVTVVNAPPAGVGSDFINLGRVFDPEFWQVMKSFVDDNFTLLGLFIAVCGLPLMGFMFFRDSRNLGYRFTLAYFAGFLVWFVILSDKLNGHSYHQFPIGPLVILLMGFFIIVLASNAASLAYALSRNQYAKEGARFLVITIFFLLLLGPSLKSRNRMFDTQFFGLDIAGDFIRENSQPGEGVIHSSHQSYGVLWHADRFGYKPPSSVEELKRLEELNTKWILAYQWGIQTFFGNEELISYIQDNYELVQMGFYVQSEQQVQPFYFLFRKGGSFNESDFNNILRGHVDYRDYELTGGTFRLYHAEV